MRDSPLRNRRSSIPLSLAIPALAALFVGGSALIWSMRSAPTRDPDEIEKHLIRVSRAEEDFRVTENVSPKFRKSTSVPESRSSVHSIRRVEENGIKLVLIRLVAGGDELVLNAVTGELIQTRPAAGNPAGGNAVEVRKVDQPKRLPDLRQVLSSTGAITGLLDANCSATLKP